MEGWRIYINTFSVIIILSGIGRFVLYFRKPGLVSRLDLFEGLVGITVIPALLGFAYRRPYGSQSLWMFLSVILCGFSIYQFFTPKMHKLYQKGVLASSGVITLQAALGGPALWALIKYSFFDPALWN